MGRPTAMPVCGQIVSLINVFLTQDISEAAPQTDEHVTVLGVGVRFAGA